MLVASIRVISKPSVKTGLRYRSRLDKVTWPIQWVRRKEQGSLVKRRWWKDKNVGVERKKMWNEDGKNS